MDKEWSFLLKCLKFSAEVKPLCFFFWGEGNRYYCRISGATNYGVDRCMCLCVYKIQSTVYRESLRLCVFVCISAAVNNLVLDAREKESTNVWKKEDGGERPNWFSIWISKKKKPRKKERAKKTVKVVVLLFSFHPQLQIINYTRTIIYIIPRARKILFKSNSS